MQIKRGYAEGGFLDDGAVVDDVSGNEVPTGSLEAEVRDDIPAQLSEGEFVLPADVVRFIGLDKLMKMRKAAKLGLASMEEEGQIGGSPAPAMHGEMELMGMDDESMEMDALIDGMDGESFEGDAQHFAEGGSVKKKKPTYEQYMGRKEKGLDGIKYRKYTNKAGEFMDIGFLRGEPLRPIPEGFYPVEEAPADPVVPETPVDTVGEGTGGSNMGKNDPNNPWRGITSPSDTDAIKNHHQIRSDKITRSRMSTLSNLSDKGVEKDSYQAMYNMLTPDAQELFSTRFKDPEGLDAYFTEGKNPAELMVIAQKTSDSNRRSAGLPDPGYDGKPTGKTPSLKDLFSGLVPSAEGVSSVIKNLVLGGLGVPLFALEILESVTSKDEVKKVAGFVQDSGVAITNPKPEEVTNPSVVATPAVEVVSPSAVAALATSLSVATPAVEVVSPSLKGTVEDATPNAKILAEMGIGDTQNQGAFPSALTYDAQGKAVSSTPKEIDITSEDSIADNFDPAAIAAQEDYNTSLAAHTADSDKFFADLESEGGSLGTVGEVGTVAAPSTADWMGGVSTGENEEIDKAILDKQNKEYLTSMAEGSGLDPYAVTQGWELKGIGGSVEDYVAQLGKDRNKQQAIEVDTATTDRATQTAAERAAAIARNAAASAVDNVVNDTGSRSGPPGMYDEDEKDKVKTAAEEAGYAGISGGGGKAKGGLLTKADRPKIKKMRNDNTSGLASKKKSKERAKAKKGALAAKRT